MPRERLRFETRRPQQRGVLLVQSLEFSFAAWVVVPRPVPNRDVLGVRNHGPRVGNDPCDLKTIGYGSAVAGALGGPVPGLD